VTVEYLIVGVVLVVGGVLQIWLRRGMSAEERAATRSSGRWGTALGYLAVALGTIIVIVGVGGS